MFRRRSATETTDSTSAQAAVDAAESAEARKGRPTPSRKEAEAARKDRLKPQLDRKGALRADRNQARTARAKQREALFSGDESALGARDKGSARRFVRDYVDSRYSLGEFMLPVVAVFLVVSFIPANTVRIYAISLFYLFMFALFITTILLAFRIKKAVAARYPDEPLKGIGLYGAMRSAQLRRMRLPRPQVARGEHPQ